MVQVHSSDVNLWSSLIDGVMMNDSHRIFHHREPRRRGNWPSNAQEQPHFHMHPPFHMHVRTVSMHEKLEVSWEAPHEKLETGGFSGGTTQEARNWRFFGRHHTRNSNGGFSGPTTRETQLEVFWDPPHEKLAGGFSGGATRET